MYLFKYVKKKFNSFQPNLLRKGQFQNTFDNKTDESGSAFFFVYVALRSGTRAGQLLHVLDSAFNYRNK